MPTARYSLAAAVVDGKLYAIGGYDYNPNGRRYRNSLNTVEVFEGGVWSTAPPMPTARSQLAAAVVDGKLYAIGGVGGLNGTDLNTVEVFEDGKWSTAQPMPTARSYFAAVAV